MPYGIANRTGQPPVSQVMQILDYAQAHGIDTLDTARAYGESEAVIGACADAHWRIVTKLSPLLSSDAASPTELAQRSLVQSRAALRRDRLEVLLLHRAEHRTAWDGRVWELLQEQRHAGRIGKLGVSVGTPEEAWAALEDPSVEAMQVASSLFDQRLLRAGFFSAAAVRGVELFVRSVFLQGVAFLDPEQLPPFLVELRPLLEELRALCSSLGLSLAAACIHFARARFSAQLVLGAESLEQVQGFVQPELEPHTQAALERFGSALPELSPQLLNPACWPK
jgi:aryl-alcohol dehydrogenase-like predicted oxidoreductase